MTTRRLVDILASHSTDKNSAHSYGGVYEDLLAPYRDMARFILEIGIGSGGSLRAWREYFSTAHIRGMDVRPECKLDEPRISTYIGDQRNPSDLANVCRLEGTQGQVSFDIVIDDGCHDPAAQVLSLFFLWPSLAPGGLYVIEDIQDPSIHSRFAVFANSRLIDRRHIKNRGDDMLVVISKPK